MYTKLIYPIVGATFLFGAGVAMAQTTPKTPPDPVAKSDATKPDTAKTTLT